MKTISLNNEDSYFNPEANVFIEFNLYKWIEDHKNDESLMSGLSEFVIEWIAKSVKDCWVSQSFGSSFNEDKYKILNQVCEYSKNNGLIDETNKNYINSLKKDLEKAIEHNREMEKAFNKINSYLYDNGLNDLRYKLIDIKYHNEKN